MSKVDNTPFSSEILVDNHSFQLTSTNQIAGYELNVSGDFEINHFYIPNGWNLVFSDKKIILYSMSLEENEQEIEINFTGDFQYNSGIAANFHGNVYDVKLVEIPTQFYLAPAYPNPFNPVTTIEFGVPDPNPAFPSTGEGELGWNNVKLQVYDINGRQAATLLNRKVEPGFHRVEWQADDLPGGIYFVKLETQNFTDVQKVLLLK